MEMAFSTGLYNTDYYSVRNFNCFSFSFSYSNSKVLFYKDCSLGSVKNPSNNTYSFPSIIIKQCHSEYTLCFVAWLYRTHYDSVSNFNCLV